MRPAEQKIFLAEEIRLEQFKDFSVENNSRHPLTTTSPHRDPVIALLNICQGPLLSP